MEQQEELSTQSNLSLADITLSLQIIQVAAQRGAFKPEEFEEVGGCYTRVLSFLEASGAIKRAPAESEVTTNDSVAASTANTVAATSKKPAAKKPVSKKAATKSKGKTE